MDSADTATRRNSKAANRLHSWRSIHKSRAVLPFRRTLFGTVSATLLCAGCNWLSLAANALTYDTLQSGEAGNVAATDSIVYATQGGAGLVWLDSRSGNRLGSLSPPLGSESIDDIAVDGELLFALDAEAPGHLAVFSLANPLQPALISAPRLAAVGPFSGVSAADGVVMVSGGTSQLAVWQYDRKGHLEGPLATADLGRGQPDIVVTANGLAYASTHYWGPYFGLDILRYDSSTHVLSTLSELRLDGAGFTKGGAKPANFPLAVQMFGADTLLIAFARGVAVVGISNPEAPLLLQVIDVGGKAVSIGTRGREAVVAVAAPNPAVVILEFNGSGPPNTKRISLPPGTNPAGIAFTGARVAVAARERGVLLIDR